DFLYVACTVEKKRLQAPGWRQKAYFYEKAITPIVGGLTEYLRIAQACKGASPLKAQVTADDNKDAVYFTVLSREFKKHKSDSGHPLVETVKPGRSKSCSLLQLADMVCGAVIQARTGKDGYLRLLAKRKAATCSVP